MKKAMLFASILAAVLSAKAATVNFAALPTTTTPTLVPNGYSNLDWSNFSYVAPNWSGAGEGFRQGPIALDVAYLGGGECEKEGASCSASIHVNAGATSLQGFVAQSAIVTAGYHAETIKVSAYNRGNFVGSQQYDLTTSLQQISFPAGWGTITQIVIDTNTGTVVLYALQVQPISTHSAANSNAAGADSPVYNPGPTAIERFIDPPADGIVRPPVSGPNASKNPGAVVHYSDGTGAGGIVVEPPVASPVAQESGKFVGRYLDGAGAANIVVEPPVASPVAHRNGKSVGRYSQSSGSDRSDIVLQGPNARSAGPIAPKNGGIQADGAVLQQPDAQLLVTTAHKKGGIQPDGLEDNVGATGPAAISPAAHKNGKSVGRYSDGAGTDGIVVQPPVIAPAAR